MSGPAFGFSAGDFFSAISLVIKISAALKDAGGAADEYKSLLSELKHLQALLEHLQQLPAVAWNAVSSQDAVRAMALSVQFSLKAFMAKLQSYDKQLGFADTTFWRSGKRKIQWAVCMEEEIRKMHQTIATKLASLSVLQLTPLV